MKRSRAAYEATPNRDSEPPAQPFSLLNGMRWRDVGTVRLRLVVSGQVRRIYTDCHRFGQTDKANEPTPREPVRSRDTARRRQRETYRDKCFRICFLMIPAMTALDPGAGGFLYMYPPLLLRPAPPPIIFKNTAFCALAAHSPTFPQASASGAETAPPEGSQDGHAAAAANAHVSRTAPSAGHTH